MLRLPTLSRERIMLLLASAAVSLLVIPLWFPWAGVPLRLLEWRVQNLIHADATPAPLRDDIVVLGIDDASLEVRSAWEEDIQQSTALRSMKQGYPWSRAVYADAIQRLLDAGARCVFLDLMFTGPSGEHPEGDAALRRVIDANPTKVVLAASFTEQLGINGVTSLLQKPWDGLVPDTNPPPPNVGFINYWPDEDQIVRAARYQRSMFNEDAERPDLAMEDAMPSAAAAMLRLAGLGSVVPANDQPHSLRFSHPGAYPPYSLHEIFVPTMWQGNFASGQVFKDKFILIGATAPHMQDFLTTPVGRMTGVQLHAQVLAAALNGAFVSVQPRWSLFASLIVAALGAWAMAAYWRRPLTTTAMLGVGTLGGFALAWWLFEHGSKVTYAVAPLLCFLLSGLLCLAYDHVLERRQRQRLRDYLTRYFSPDVVALMLREPEQFHRLQRGAHRTITVLFSDLRGFTTMSETMAPEQVVKQLNGYFNRMVGIVHDQEGGIDKFIGDAIMAVWGWVGGLNNADSQAANARDAVGTILRMRQGLDELNREWATQGIAALRMGVGIHQGAAIVGDLGSERQSGFTVIGDTVNLASRIEGATKEYGVDNLITDAVRQHLGPEFHCATADLLTVKGKTVPVELFTVLCEGEAPAQLATWEQAMQAYRRGDFAQAKELFLAAKDLHEHLPAVFIARCEALIASPPASWDGVFVMTKK